MPEAYTLVEHAALAPLNTFGVAATARWLAEVRDAAAIPAVLALPAVSGAPVMVLGEGSNVLFAADFPGLILRTAFDSVRVLDDDGSTALVRAEAGAGWDALVDWTLARGLAGLENLALIPGLVGAAPIQNIGAYGVEVAESIATVEAWDRHAGRFDRLDARAVRVRATATACSSANPSDGSSPPSSSVCARRARPRLDYAGVREELVAQGVTADADAAAGGRCSASAAAPQAAGPGRDRQRRQLLQEPGRRRQRWRRGSAREHPRGARVSSRRRAAASCRPPG